MAQKEQVKFLTNISERLTFKFGDFKSGESAHGPWYLYTVEHKGEDKALFPSAKLHSMLQSIGSLEGRTLEILKYEDGNVKMWKILENGQDITPKGNPAPKQEGIDPIKLREAFTALTARVTELEKKVSGHDTLLLDLRGKDAVDFHGSFKPSVDEWTRLSAGDIDTEYK